MRSAMVIVLVIVVWVFIAPRCMTFRNADSVMVNRFRKNGITLTTIYEKVNGTNIHYAKPGYDSSHTIGELIIPGGNHFIPWTKFAEIKKVLLELKPELHLQQAKPL